MRHKLKFDEKYKDVVLKLHLELNLDGLDDQRMNILKLYDQMDKSISRDILVPANITLHALHYAILRMFGWQNGHLHCFELPPAVFKKLTKNSFMEWSRLVGVYFRYSQENFEDIYWDDDYSENGYFKTWLKKKYTGPYYYNGLSEHFILSQISVQKLMKDNPKLKIQKYLDDKPKYIPLDKLTMDQMKYSFFIESYEELLERLPLSKLLQLPQNKNEKLILDSQLDIMTKLFEFYDNSDLPKSKLLKYLDSQNVACAPVTKELIYKYDYGDGWEVKISLTDVYEKTNDIWYDINQQIQSLYNNQLDTVVSKLSPICIDKDGIELVDDVGGIRGFCDMLKCIYEYDPHDQDSIKEREHMLGWVDYMGWNGKWIKPEKTL